MTEALKQAAQQAIEAYEAFGEADDVPTLLALSGKIEALRTALTQATASEPDGFGDFDVLQITTAYEQGFGHAFRDELSNPYPAGQKTHTAWQYGRDEGKRKHTAQPAPAKAEWHDGTRGPFDGAPMSADKAAFFMRRFKHEEKLLGPNEQAAIDFVLKMLEPAPAARPMTDDQVWHNEALMSANGIVGFQMDALMRIVRAVEAHHRIGQPTAPAVPAEQWETSPMGGEQWETSPMGGEQWEVSLPDSSLSAAPAAVPAVPEDVAKNAARYVWLCTALGETQLPTLIERITQNYVADYKPSIGAAIDSAMMLTSAPTSTKGEV